MNQAKMVPFEAATGPKGKRTPVTLWRAVEEGTGFELLPMNASRYGVQMFVLGYNLAIARTAAAGEEAGS